MEKENDYDYLFNEKDLNSVSKIKGKSLQKKEKHNQLLLKRYDSLLEVIPPIKRS